MEKPIKIIVENNGRKIELTTHWDSDIDDWCAIFKTIMTWLTFTPESIDAMFREDE